MGLDLVTEVCDLEKTDFSEIEVRGLKWRSQDNTLSWIGLTHGRAVDLPSV
jgi:hypothetical protein